MSESYIQDEEKICNGVNKIYFAMALHFHQPVGNFDDIFERAIKLCYKPFLKLLYNYSDIKMTFHISGCLLDYLEEKHPDVIGLIKEMVLRRQIELMGGGYYEPILVAIPERDIMGQIRMMNEYIEEKFNLIPKGIWIPERVWESWIIKPIYESGLRYCVLDDAHFLRSGIKKQQLHGYFLTGRGKEKIAVFPSDKTLRYTIPFKLPHETIDYFKNESKDKEDILFTYGDDGEKFGEWPGTHKWVFEEEWLRKFFDCLYKNKNWIELVHLSNYLKNNKPIDTIDIKQGSYEEMMQWTGGSWMNFLSKYPEANQMHKKMFYVSGKIKNAEKITDKKESEKVKAAKKELYKGQCNCGYWHGVFGGLYLYHLRSAIYNHLITAEKMADELLHKDKKNWLDIEQIDFDSDGEKEVFIENKTFSLCIAPDEGGILKELDYRPHSLNLINTLSRKKESYHEKILHSVKNTNHEDVATIHNDFRTIDPVLKEKLTYDEFPKYCLRNYFLSSSYEELGDFATACYKTKIKTKTVILEHDIKISQTWLKLSKKIQIKSDKEIEVIYEIEKGPKDKLNAIFVTEFNITMPYLNSSRYSYFYNNKAQTGLNTQGEIPGVDSFGISDSEKSLSINFNFSKIPNVMQYFPIETVSQSERAYELNYQCSSIVPKWKPGFDKNGKWALKIIWQMV